MPWQTAAELTPAANSTESFIRLGSVGSIEFLSNCPLCRCLFTLTPNPSSAAQVLHVLTDWTMNRLAGETPTVTDTTHWAQFRKCLIVFLDGEAPELEFSTRVHRGDALAMLDEEDDASHVLGGRVIAPDEIDVGMVEAWLSSCSRCHGEKCRPEWHSELRHIKLVDVATRQIVQAPEGRFEYTALSYVWGGGQQDSYQAGSELKGALPQTTEDAIDLTGRLGKRYLWVDSLCIDQTSAADKERQINLMCSIYQGAYLTIVAVSGTSATAGLPRMRAGTAAMQPQLFCRVDGKRLVGLMPTLSQQIWRSPWGSRAWTLQEALLSPRSLYVSDHQLYFECNGMQCCESLNDTQSAQSPEQGGWLASRVGDGCLRTPIDIASQRLERYGSKLTLYSYRRMTVQSDGLNAFSGILSFLGRMYPGGVSLRPPLEDLQWGLLWGAQGPSLRRPGFPSWSWAGWQGGLWPGYPRDFTKPHESPVHLHIQTADRGGCLVDVFRSSHPNTSPTDPILAASKAKPAARAVFNPAGHQQTELDHHLYIEAVVLRFSPDYSQPWGEHRPCIGTYGFFTFWLRQTRCFIKIMSTDEEVYVGLGREKQKYVLLAREWNDGFVYHHLLQLGPERDHVATRRTVLALIVPDESLGVLQGLNPTKEWVVLA
ncbi:heterokaryon incompatibility protein-domain-containing protein [Parachaetomium inaequale]|uniref:Heterokaryon incompatibility protein-domain-containing protein n=1 Tax=Parachaetomium inaequale TaxID=2588326 RepID=A0AAN6SP36_9PEZI|nr:heterokaryon incompatibility protein-domain-containing protein [Parachaetomium inaequale]